MKSRRQFVIKGRLAATAILFGQHFKSFAIYSSPQIPIDSTDLLAYNNHLVFLHSMEQKFSFSQGLISSANKMHQSVPNSILINSSANHSADFSLDISSKEKYSIICKGNITTGVIYAKPNEENVLIKTEELAALLKQEKNCSLVVCVSHLGHKQKNSIDDLTLASLSTNIDIIINGHETNFLPKTMIVSNSQKKEVIVQSSKDNHSSFAKLEIGFDERGTKKHIHLATKLFKDIEAA